jgi:outer membrane protein TolC
VGLLSWSLFDYWPLDDAELVLNRFRLGSGRDAGFGLRRRPDFEHPPPPEVTRYTPEPLAPRTTATAGVQGGQAQRFINGRDIPGEWWRLFGSRPLNSLVQKSLIANPNLQAAQAALRQAQELLAAQKGKFFPSADVSFTPTRQQRSGSLGAVTSTPATLFNLYTAQVAVTYTLDVWGQNRTVESMQAQADNQRFLVEAASPPTS